MALQIGTVDGLVYISEEKIKCFVNAIKSFSDGGVNYSLRNNVSIGAAFQRYVNPVYNKTRDRYDFKDITQPVYTSKGAEQSPARVTYCKKMGLLNFNEENYTFNLTPIGNAIYKDEITISEYAFLLISKLGVFKDKKYVGNVLTDIASYFERNIFATDAQMIDYFIDKYNDDEIEKTRLDVILGALEEAQLVKKFSSKEEKGYIVSGLASADILNDFKRNSIFLSPAILDSDSDYALYIGNMENGALDIISEDNISIYEKKYPNLVKYKKNRSKNIYSNMNNKIKIDGPLQQIFYGAPGTGKSYATNEVAGKSSETIRTTFHPDSDYSTFVGAYKPTTTKDYRFGLDGTHTVHLNYPDGEHKGEPIKDNKIEYKFIKQAFLKAYIKAWNLFKESCVDGQELKPQFLVIEEINRGNCAQIFGDLFQLLDRKDGFSEYPIETDEDIQKALLEEYPEDGLSFGKNGIEFTPEQIDYINSIYDKEGEPSQEMANKISAGRVLVLPPNLYIWATMNTSDQSLFPIDSAFKRRWSWKYIRIAEGKKKDGTPLNYRIKFTIPGEEEPVDESWWDFVRAINKHIEEATKSEDKKLGYFFCKPDKKADVLDKCNTIISAEAFVGKVVFYLWQDVFKDYSYKKDIFKSSTGKISFHDFYPADEETDKENNPDAINLKLVKEFITLVLEKNKEE